MRTGIGWWSTRVANPTMALKIRGGFVSANMLAIALFVSLATLFFLLLETKTLTYLQWQTSFYVKWDFIRMWPQLNSTNLKSILNILKGRRKLFVWCWCSNCLLGYGNQRSTSHASGDEGSAFQCTTFPYGSTLNLAGSKPAFLHSIAGSFRNRYGKFRHCITYSITCKGGTLKLGTY